MGDQAFLFDLQLFDLGLRHHAFQLLTPIKTASDKLQFLFDLTNLLLAVGKIYRTDGRLDDGDDLTCLHQ